MDSVEFILPTLERIEYVDIRRFLLDLVEGEIIALEILTTSFYVISDKYKSVWDFLRGHAN
jgi:hypothetical protein